MFKRIIFSDRLLEFSEIRKSMLVTLTPMLLGTLVETLVDIPIVQIINTF